MTDCKGTLSIGDYGLTLADLRIYPFALSEDQLLEIHEEGSTLEDLIMSTIPTRPATTDTDVILHNLRTVERTLYQVPGRAVSGPIRSTISAYGPKPRRSGLRAK